jgi:uncharacterized protein
MAANNEEKLDFLSKMRIRELVLLGLITIAAVVANLPREYVENTLGIDHHMVLAVLAIAVIIGLFLNLKFGSFVAVILLIAAANMPDQIAEGLNVSKAPIVIALVALIGVGLINYFVKMMPTGLEVKPREKSPEGVKALFYAVEKGNLVYAQKVLMMNFDPNLLHDNGYSPLSYAAMKGNLQMVELLLRNGADPSLTTKDGDTPTELALKMGHGEVADALKRARQSSDAPADVQPAAQAS